MVNGEQRFVDIETPKGKTRFEIGEVEQAERLILKGKETAARGDPRLQNLIQALIQKGVRSPVPTQQPNQSLLPQEDQNQSFLRESEVRQQSLLPQNEITQPAPQPNQSFLRESTIQQQSILPPEPEPTRQIQSEPQIEVFFGNRPQREFTRQEQQVQPFDRSFGVVPFLTESEVVGRGGFQDFFLGAGAFVAQRGRQFFGEKRAEDLTERAIIPFGDFSQTRTRVIATGTDIDIGSGIRPEVTIEERARLEFFAGQSGVPLQFIAEDIQRDVIGKEQTRLTGIQTGLQSQIDTGAITVQEAETRLESERVISGRRAESEFEKRFLKEATKSGAGSASLETFRKAQRPDVSGFVEAGVIGGGLVAGTVTGTLPLVQAGILSVGGLETISAVGRPEGEKLSTAISGGTKLVIGAGVFGSAARGIQAARAESTLQKGLRDPFKQGELITGFGETPSGSGVAVTGGLKRRAFDEGIVELKFLSRSPTLKAGDRLVDVGKGKLRADIKISPIDVSGRLSSPARFTVEKEFFNIGSFQALSTETAGTTAVVGRTAPVQKRLLGDVVGPQRAVSGISQRIGTDTFRTQTGQLRRVGVFTERPDIVQLDVGRADVGLVRVVRPTRVSEDVVGVTGGFRTGFNRNLAKQFRSTSPKFQQDVALKSISSQQTVLSSQQLRTAVSPRSAVTGRIVTGRGAGGVGSQRAVVSQKDMEVQMTALAPKQLSGQIQQSRLKERQAFASTPAQTSAQAFRVQESFAQPAALSQAQAPRLDTQQKVKGLGKLGFGGPAPPITPTTITPSFKGEFGFGFTAPLPPIPVGFPTFPVPRGTPRKRTFERTPSFAAAQLGFESAAPLDFEATGLVERPVIRKKKKKKRR